jgi:hypothetical protein
MLNMAQDEIAARGEVRPASIAGPKAPFVNT